jgi:protein-glutamine gamma-glutamyltransferase
MIKIGDNIISQDAIAGAYKRNSMENKIFDVIAASTREYEYKSLELLKFELSLRANIISASRELFKSKMSFRVFRRSICNPDFWDRTNNGGFIVKDGVKPSDAIKDIFVNGSLYGTECATAIVIVYYKAVVNIYPEELFNKMFPKIHLMNWHYDRDLGVEYKQSPGDFFPGDCRYFKNPDVNPETPQWQGENAIDLGNGQYYGHGLGIRTADEMISILNQKRKEGAAEPATLLDSATRPDFKYLGNKFLSYVPTPAPTPEITLAPTPEVQNEGTRWRGYESYGALQFV